MTSPWHSSFSSIYSSLSHAAPAAQTFLLFLPHAQLSHASGPLHLLSPLSENSSSNPAHPRLFSVKSLLKYYPSKDFARIYFFWHLSLPKETYQGILHLGISTPLRCKFFFMARFQVPTIVFDLIRGSVNIVEWMNYFQFSSLIGWALRMLPRQHSPASSYLLSLYRGSSGCGLCVHAPRMPTLTPAILQHFIRWFPSYGSI